MGAERVAPDPIEIDIARLLAPLLSDRRGGIGAHHLRLRGRCQAPTFGIATEMIVDLNMLELCHRAALAQTQAPVGPYVPMLAKRVTEGRDTLVLKPHNPVL